MNQIKPSPAGSGAERLYWLDWLRFGAAFIVMSAHLRGGSFADYADLAPKYHNPAVAMIFALSRVGLEAVILFFVLSGFLVGGRSAQRAREGRFGTRAYAVDRITRIYVPLIPALLLTAGVLLYLGQPVSGREFLGNLAGLQGVGCGNFGGNAPLWSLAYEIWFYILCGGVLTLLAPSRLPVRVVAWLAALAGLMIFTRLEAVYLYCWLLGAAAYVVKPVMSRRGCITLGLVLAVSGVIGSQLASGTVSLKLDRVRELLPPRPVDLLTLGMGLALLIKALSEWAPQSPRWRAFEALGSIPAGFSYTLYLVHVPVLLVCETVFPGRANTLDFKSMGIYLVKMFICLGSAWGMYLLFERNTGHVRRWAARILAVRGKAGSI